MGEFTGKTDHQLLQEIVECLCIANKSIFQVSDEFTRPADVTAYATGDAINNSTTVPEAMEFELEHMSGRIRSIRIETDEPGLTSSLRLFLFTEEPSMSNDNAANVGLYAEGESRLVGLTQSLLGTGLGTGSDYSYIEIGGLDIPFIATNQKLWGYLVAGAALTPVSAQKFKVILFIEQ